MQPIIFLFVAIPVSTIGGRIIAEILAECITGKPLNFWADLS